MKNLCTLLAFWICLAASARAEERVDYLRQIKPLLASRCYECHGALKQKSGLRLDTTASIRKGGKGGAAIHARNADKSPLIARVTAADKEERMPPEGEPLKPEQIQLLKTWIKQGAIAPKDEKPEPDPRQHWAFLPPVRAVVPRVKGADSIRNPIDAFITAEQQLHGLKPLPPADRTVLLRRVYLDLVGLPPTREELHAFLADTSSDAYLRVVDRLLGSPQYGERWARHWMDVWRYADWFGRRQVPDVWNSAAQIWRWRDWIVKSLNTDKGYDRMVAEMLAADELAPTEDETAVATGYLVRNWYALNPNQWMRENVEHTGKSFLGLTFNCAHCHDHKYDPITQQDYFSFRAFFEPIYVRQDRWPGEAEPGKFQDYDYSVLRKVQRLGAVRVFDKTADAKTWFYTGGDERNRQTNRPPVSPAMPEFLGGKSLQVTPVSLPPAGYYPGLRTAIQEAELNERRNAITQAETGLAALQKANSTSTTAQRDALAKAEADFNTALAEAAKSRQPAALAGKQSLVFDATAGRRVLTHPLAGLKELPEGATVRYQLHLLADKYAGFQLSKDTAAGLTAAYIGFVGGKIHSYKPGTTTEFEAGHYAFTNGQHTFEVTLALEPKTDRALLTVRSTSDSKTLVDQLPIAINGWNPAKNKNQGILLDAQASTIVVWDELSVTAGDAKLFHFDFESPRFTDGKDIGGIEGWEVSRFSAAPATSTVSSIALNRSLSEKRLAVIAAHRAIELPTLARTAAESRHAAARAELRSVEARLAADTAKYGKAGAPVSDPARAASTAERTAALTSAKSKVDDAQLAIAQAEAKPSADKSRSTALQTSGQQLTDAQAALRQAESALADPKLGETYTAFSTVYPSESTGRRRALAQWLGNRANPLTARVAVNHIWAWHFQEPLVRTVYDFGRSGAKPTHPELLDWLAVEFMESGWSMKHLHRLLVTSEAYRRSSSVISNQYSVTSNSGNGGPRKSGTLTTGLLTTDYSPAQRSDPENKFLWRMNPGRMEAEVIRDSVLRLAGELDGRMGGQELENTEMPASRRRSLYFACYPEDGGKGEFTGLFDAPDANECYRRTRSIVPQQALALTNSKFTHDASATLAKRLGETPDADPANRDHTAFITAAYEQILTRPPSRAELTECAAFLQRQTSLLQTQAGKDQTAASQAAGRARESLVRALLSHNDFVTVR